MRVVDRSPGPPLTRGSGHNHHPGQSPILKPGAGVCPYACLGSALGAKRRVRTCRASGSSFYQGSCGREGIFKHGLGNVRLPGVRRRRRQTVAAAAGAPDGWQQAVKNFAERVLKRLVALGALLRQLWKDNMHHLQTWYSKALAVSLLLLVGVTAVANIWGVQSLNHRVLPQATQTASMVLEREVSLGKVRWLAPTGLVGLTPVASIGPVEVGPSSLEGSSAVLPEVLVRLDPLQSLLKRKLMLQLQADKAQVAMVQNSNFSWFGYPEDTEPSTRNFLPGLHKVLKPESAKLGDLQPEIQTDVPQQAETVTSSEDAKLAQKADRRRNFPVPPESAANFRPAVGRDLVQHAQKESSKKLKGAALQQPQRSIAAVAATTDDSLAGTQKSERPAAAVQGTVSSEDEWADSHPTFPPPGSVENAIQPAADFWGGMQIAAPASSPPEPATETAAAAQPSEVLDKGDSADLVDSPDFHASQAAEPSSTEELADGNHGANSAQEAPESSAEPATAAEMSEQPRDADEAGALEGAFASTADLEQEAGVSHDSSGIAADSSVKTDAADQSESAELDVLNAAVPLFTPPVESTSQVTADDYLGLKESAMDRGAQRGSGAAKFGFASISSSRIGAAQPVTSVEAAQPAESLHFDFQSVARAEEASASTQASEQPALEMFALAAEPGRAIGHHPEQDASAALSELGISHVGLISPAGDLIAEQTEHGAAESGAYEGEDVESAAVEEDAQGDSGDREGKRHECERRIQESREASISGRDVAGAVRVRHHGGFREHGFPRPALRRTSRSYLRKHMPLEAQIQPRQSRLAPGLSDSPLTSLEGIEFDIATDGSTIPALLPASEKVLAQPQLEQGVPVQKQAVEGLFSKARRLTERARAGALQQRWQTFRDAAQEEATSVLRAAQQGPSISDAAQSQPSEPADETSSQSDLPVTLSAAASPESVAGEPTEPSPSGQPSEQPSLPMQELAAPSQPRKKPSRWANLRDARRLIRQGPAGSRGAGFSALRQARDAARARHLDFSLREAAQLVVASQDVAAGDIMLSERPSHVTFGTASELASHKSAVEDEAEAEERAGVTETAEQSTTDAEAGEGDSQSAAELPQDDAGQASEEVSDAQLVLAAVPEASPGASTQPEEREPSLELDLSKDAPVLSESADVAPQAETGGKLHRAAAASQGEPRVPKPKQRAHVKRPRVEEEDTGPRYKPGAQVLLEGGSQRGLGGWLSRQTRAAFKNVKLPQVGVESVRIRNGKLQAFMAGEPIARQIDNVDLTVRLSSDYCNMTLDVAGNAHERDPASGQCTMLSANPIRHLRDVPSKPIRHAPNEPAVLVASDQSSAISFKLGGMGSLRGSLNDLAADAKLRAEAFEGEEDGSREYSLAERTPVKEERHWWGGRRSSTPKPTGGRIQVRVVSKGLHLRYPDTHISLWGTNLHAPMAEHILEIPIDVYEGRFDGDFRMHAHNAETWRLPMFQGRVRCRGMAFHFWDATDDFSDTHMDLLFEGHRLYLHNARGSFGAVPLTITGDMDLDPDVGQYRLSASVPGVEMNDLRKTLGIRPTPFPVGGALRGVLHCTGPLEQPVFSGTAVALPPSREAVESMEDSAAKETLLAEPQAAGAYDKVPFASASAVFTMDTSNDIFLLHSIQAEPLDGGQLLGAGRMWVAPQAEQDPRAVKVHLEGHGLPFEPLLLRYLPKGMHLPPSLVLGDGNVHGTMEGSHMAPTIRTRWDCPAASASGTADFTPKTTKFTCRAPALDVSGAVHVQPPDFEAVKKATTQQEVSSLSAPVLEGCDLDVDFKGLDVLPIVSPPEALEHINSSQPMRLKLNGRTKFSGRMQHSERASSTAEQGPQARESSFAGDLSLDGVRVNQLKLTRNLSGTLSVSEHSLQIHAKGSRPDEALDVSLKLPLLSPELADPDQQSTSAPSGDRPNRATETPFGISLGDILPLPGFGAAKAGSGDVLPIEPSQDGGGGHFSLRCGQLLMSAEVNGTASMVDCQVQGMKLDELELASLRGEMEEASLHVNLEARQGRAQVVVQGPRFSGLHGESLSTAVRWERDVVRLERAILQQRNSRYEVQGEYVIPANVAIPRSAASMASASRDSSSPQWSPFQSSSGRWRIQINVPTAQMEEILPAARLLSRATSPTPSDYERAKSVFLKGVQEAAIHAQELGRQLEAAAESARAQLQSSLPDDHAGPSGHSSKGGSQVALPGLQDLKGQWNGTFQAYGGGGGAANVDFNMRGQEWKWGDYALDQAVAQGSCHSLEGVKLEEVSLKAGAAKLMVRGKLLTTDQSASILLSDFPVALLQPLFRSMPALEHAAPAAGSGSSGGSSNGGFGGLTMPFGHRSADRAEMSARPYTPHGFSNSPVNGLLYLRGTIGGTAALPEGELFVELDDGAIGPTQLSQAQASASLDAAQRMSFSMELAPAEPRAGGFARVSGSVPLRPSMGVESAPPGDKSSDTPVDAVEVNVHVKDGGMKLVRILTPDFRWQSGSADIKMRLHGRPASLALDGGAQVGKATITSPFLKYPMTNVAASVNLADNVLQVENVEAKVGRRGFIRIKGDLPVASSRTLRAGFPEGRRRSAWNAIVMDIHDLELRLRNVYTGYLDASLQTCGSLTQPIVGGSVRLSRGVAMLVPQATPEAREAPEPAPKEGDLVQKAFTVLTRKDGLAKQLSRPQGDSSGSAAVPNLLLKGLQIRLGPELRAMYPVVVNMGISGDVEVNGPADINLLRLKGLVNLDSGEINLVATQLVLDREHNNRLVFDGQEGLDPMVDLSLRGAQIRAAIQGRASTWHHHLLLTPISAPAGEAAEQLQPSEAARIFEGQLASALVAEDGQLALSNLAVSAAHGFMPKIQTQGQLGQARWRLVSAPSIPGLLSLDPTGDPTSLLSSLTMGTEVEVQFGNSLQAAMARKLRDSDIATQWTLNYQLNSKLRMQFTIASIHPYPRTLLFQYTGDSN